MSRNQTPITAGLARYLREETLREPEPLRRLREETEDHPQGRWQIAPEQGQFLHFLACVLRVRKALEVGTFMGYSSTWVALALPAGGKLVACDTSVEYTARARNTWRESGVEDRIELRLGPALDTLDALLSQGHAGTFDLAFIDADKDNYEAYYERSLALVRSGGVIVADNVLLHGKVGDPHDTDADTRAIRAFNRKLQADDRVAISVATMGDGFMLACKY